MKNPIRTLLFYPEIEKKSASSDAQVALLDESTCCTFFLQKYQANIIPTFLVYKTNVNKNGFLITFS